MYLMLKLLHVAGVVAFLGNMTAGLFWHSRATRIGEPRLLLHTMDGIIRSDTLFTLPGVIVITASGIWAAMIGGHPLLSTPWIAGSIVLFSASGVMFTLRVAPLQKRLRALARKGIDSGSFDDNAYSTLTRRWRGWALATLLTPLLALALMVLKPGQ